MQPATCSHYSKVYNICGKRLELDTATASENAVELSPNVELVPLMSSEFEKQLDDHCWGENQLYCDSSSSSAASAPSPFIVSPVPNSSKHGEEICSGDKRMFCNKSSSSYRRIWLRKVRNTRFSVCENCGTPFETETPNTKNCLRNAAGCGLQVELVRQTSPALHVELPQDLQIIEERSWRAGERRTGTTDEAAETPASLVAVDAVLAQDTHARMVLTAAEKSMPGGGDNKPDIRCGQRRNTRGFSSTAMRCDYRRLAKQQRLYALHVGNSAGKRHFFRQPLSSTRVSLFRRSVHAPQTLPSAKGSAVTRFFLGAIEREAIKDAETLECKGREGKVKKDSAEPAAYRSAIRYQHTGVNDSKVEGSPAESTSSYVAYSSPASASSSLSMEPSFTFSASSADPISSASSAEPVFSGSPATASSSSSPSVECESGYEFRCAGSGSMSCRIVSPTTDTRLAGRHVIRRAGSTTSTCANSSWGSSRRSSGVGRKCFNRWCGSFLGCTWGWAFQRDPPATWRDYLSECKCGVAIALSQLPATMTCAIVANVPVTSALHGAWITGLITAIFGGSPLSVTTVTSSLAVTLAKVTRTVCDEKTNICVDEGLEFIFPALILAGLCCLLLGTLRLSRFSQFVPSATIVGYLNAVAILNVKAQVVTLKFDPVTSTGYEWLWVVLMITTVFTLMCIWEKIPRIRINALVPASVLGLAVSSFIEFVLVRGVCGMQTKTVAALSNLGYQDDRGEKKVNDSIGFSLWPRPFFLTPANVQPFSFYFRLQDLLTMLELTLGLVMVNYMSTLITVDMLSDKSSHLHLDSKPDQHLVSVGLANVVACFLGALPGSTAPSPSLLNLKLGGKSREGAVIGALVNLAFVAASSYFLDLVPLGGLAGIIMYTAYHAFQWRTVAAVFASFLPECLRMKHPVLQRKICRSDAFVMLLTTAVALCADIGTAILAGVCIASCVFAWKNAVRLRVASRLDIETGVKFYRVKGPIFFLTKRRLLRYFEVDKDPKVVILELSDEAEQLFDYGALETLDALVTRYRHASKLLKVVGLQRGDRKMIVKAGRLFELAQIELVEKPVDDSASVKTIADMMKLPC